MTPIYKFLAAIFNGRMVAVALLYTFAMGYYHHSAGVPLAYSEAFLNGLLMGYFVNVFIFIKGD